MVGTHYNRPPRNIAKAMGKNSHQRVNHATSISKAYFLEVFFRRVKSSFGSTDSSFANLSMTSMLAAYTRRSKALIYVRSIPAR